MPFIKPIRDDFAIREIQRQQAKQTSIQAPREGQASVGIDTPRPNTPLKRTNKQKERRRSNDRRQTDRRAQRSTVLLDTRGNRDRRQGDRRGTEAPEAAQRLKRRLHHIDVYS